MKTILKILAILFFCNIGISQELATTSDGRQVFLNEDGTYTFLKENSSSSSKGTLKGVCTYFFNNNYGNKPDIGSKILIRKTTSSDSLHKNISNFNFQKPVHRILLSNAKNIKSKKEREAQLSQLAKEYDNYANIALSHLIKVDLNKEKKEITVDGSGNYIIDLEPGFYEVIIISKNRQSTNVAEIKGKIKNKLIEIKSNETTVLDFETKI